MKAGLILLWMVGLGYTETTAQNAVCTQELLNAEEQYNMGHFDEAIDLLKGCLNKDGLVEAERKKAYHLLGLTYIAKDLHSEAREAIEKLVELIPSYMGDPTGDPPAFIELLADVQGQTRGHSGSDRIACEADAIVGVLKTTGRWEKIPGQAKDIGAGADGSVWIIDNGSVSRWDEAAFGWETIDGEGRHLAVDSEGAPWLVNRKGGIYRWRGSNWEKMPGEAFDIGAGTKGALWIANRKGYIFEWNEADFDWKKVEGSGERIAVSANGVPWMINKRGDIFKRRGVNWQQMPGGAIDIGAGGAKTIWIVGQNHTLYCWNEADFEWLQLAGQAEQITVDNKGRPWIINKKGEIFRLEKP